MENSEVIDLGVDRYSILFSANQIAGQIYKIGQEIKKDYVDRPQPPIIMMVLTGGLYFGVDLSRVLADLGLSHHIDTVGLKSYMSDEQGGQVKMISQPHADLGGRDIIVVEDIIDRGDTMNHLHNYLLNLPNPPDSISYCALLVKNNHGPLDFEINYQGFEIGPEWIVGYGMDSYQDLRGLCDIYVKCS